MKAFKWITGILVVSIVAILVLLAYLGFFGGMNIYERKMGPYVYAYKEFVGVYQDSLPVLAEVNGILTGEGVKPAMGVSVYIFEPFKVSLNLHGVCGAVIDEKDKSKLDALAKKLKIGNFAQADCVVAEFPLKNYLSYSIGPVKVYPFMLKYMFSKGYKHKESYELYDTSSEKIYYIMPIVK